ncbi:MAG: glycosyltransferase family 8 protein [Planctomycetaceae bacterium]|jgi:lipopolysaccharide biosynthesis glycosyltransferase|nr:glycosyltransferase family 8 protein [Planctomycetaceae bacterium]
MTKILSEPIPVFFAANVGYYQHLCVAIVSLLENNRSRNFAIYVLTDDENSLENEKIRQLKKLYDNFEITFTEIDRTKLETFYVPIKSHLTVQTYYRCFIPLLFPTLTKAIYLDSDLLIEGDIGKLWETDIEGEGYYLAGVEDLGAKNIDHKKKLGILENSVYINCGVLLINLAAWRKDDIVEKIIENSCKLGSRAELVDQDVINFTLEGGIKKLDCHFNWSTYDSINAPRKLLSHNPVIISHFTTWRKPWYPLNRCHHESAPKYFYYLRKTPYRNFIYRYWMIRSFKFVFRFWNHFFRK